MKKLFLLIVICFGFLSYGQETEFSFTKEAFTDFIVTQCEGKTQQELYKKALDWIAVTYKSPDDVIKSKIENEYIKFTGSKFGLVSVHSIYRHSKETRYTIEISFKDNRYKFDLINLEAYDNPSQYSRGGWFTLYFDNPEKYFKKNGQFINACKYHSEIPLYFNELNTNLKKFILSQTLPSKEDKW